MGDTQGKEKLKNKLRVIWFIISGCAAGDCTDSTSENVCVVVEGEVEDVRERQAVLAWLCQCIF